MAEWFTLEVLNGETSASQWADAFGDEFVRTGLSSGATNWEWHRHAWGVILEIEFVDEEAFEHFRNLPFITAALDEVPDPDNGLVIHRGRGGSSGSRDPRRPIPMSGSGAAELPIPVENTEVDELLDQVLLEERRVPEWEHARSHH
jgi:hypothetical protein